MHAVVTKESFEKWQAFADDQGLSLSGLAQSTPSVLFDMTDPAHSLQVIAEIVRESRRISSNRRRSRGKDSSDVAERRSIVFNLTELGAAGWQDFGDTHGLPAPGIIEAIAPLLTSGSPIFDHVADTARLVGANNRQNRRNRRNQSGCGTVAGYDSHRYRGTPVCDRCKRARALDRWVKANPNRIPESYRPRSAQAICGTMSGWNAHNSAEEPQCELCGLEYNIHQWMRRNPSADITRYSPTVREEDVCGTNAGYYRHRHHDTTPCEPCWEAKRIHDWARARPGRNAEDYQPQTKAQCGTSAGYARHRTEQTTPCAPCRAAAAKYAWLRNHPDKTEADYKPRTPKSTQSP